VSRRLRALGALLLLGLSAPALAKKNPLPPGERIDLNRASVAELMRLPGIGRARAEAIVAHRSKRPFRSPAEVTEVKGIGKRWLQGNQARITAGSKSSSLRSANDP
jgi:competence protein ComEA